MGEMSLLLENVIHIRFQVRFCTVLSDILNADLINKEIPVESNGANGLFLSNTSNK